MEQVKAVSKGEEPPETVVSSMVKEMSRSPNLAVAIIYRLREDGVDLLEVNGEEAEVLRDKFRPHMEKLSERELTQLKSIADKLF